MVFAIEYRSDEFDLLTIPLNAASYEEDMRCNESYWWIPNHELERRWDKRFGKRDPLERKTIST